VVTLGEDSYGIDGGVLERLGVVVGAEILCNAADGRRGMKVLVDVSEG
jgi:hypothetical protein